MINTGLALSGFIGLGAACVYAAAVAQLAVVSGQLVADWVAQVTPSFLQARL